MVFIFPSRAGGSWQAFTQTLDSAQQGGQYSHCSPAIGLPVVTWPAQTGWSVGTPPPRLYSAIRPSSLKAFCAWMWSFSVGGRVCVGECVPASPASQPSQPAVRGLFGVQCFSHVSGALGVLRQRVSREYDPRDSGYLPENGPSPQTLRVQAGQDHCQAAATQEDRRR